VWGCGSNHNETMVSDATSVQQPEGSLYAPKMAPCHPLICGTNHNETLVDDVPPLEQADALSQWLANVQAFVFATFTNNAPVRGWCEEWGCGMNHNETLANDAPPLEQANTGSRWPVSVQASIFATFTNKAPVRDRCEDWGCGMNHNETLVDDVPRLEQADAWGQWLARVQAFIFARFTTDAPVRGGCDDWGCGMNHNETLVRDSVQ
jgi:hypothetical protein